MTYMAFGRLDAAMSDEEVCPMLKGVLSAAAVLGLMTVPALAKGGGDAKSECPKGQIEDRGGKCVDKGDKSASKDALYEQGRYLARSGAYEDALQLLAYADQSDANVLTYVGFATRKLGDVEAGMDYYARALAIDPDNTITRSYLGEAHLMRDEREKAVNELERIAAIESPRAETYAALARAIEAYDGGYWNGGSYSYE